MVSSEANYLYMGKRIAFLDDNEDLRDVMSQLLRTKLKEECLCFESVAELIAHRGEVLKTKIAIIDVNLGSNKASGLDAYTWLQDNGYAGKIVFLTGHAQSHPLVASAQSCGTIVWQKPMDADQICEAIREELS